MKFLMTYRRLHLTKNRVDKHKIPILIMEDSYDLWENGLHANSGEFVADEGKKQCEKLIFRRIGIEEVGRKCINTTGKQGYLAVSHDESQVSINSLNGLVLISRIL